MEELSLTVLNPDHVATAEELAQLRLLFEQIIRQYQQTDQNQELDMGMVGEIQQKFFTRKSIDQKSPPITGIGLYKADGSTMAYGLHFFMCQPAAYENTIVARGVLDIHAKKPVSGTEYTFGSHFIQIADVFDGLIVQAAANVYQYSILHSRNIEHLNQQAVHILLSKGYQRRKGHPNMFDKFYQPQSPSA